MLDMDKINEYHDVIDDYVNKIIERCAKIYPTRYEAVAKEILYLHKLNYCEEDPILKQLVMEMNDYQNRASQDNPYINVIDENS